MSESFDFGDRRNPTVKLRGQFDQLELVVKLPDGTESVYAMVYDVGIGAWKLPTALSLVYAGSWRCAFNVWRAGETTPVEVFRFSFNVNRSPFDAPFARAL